MLSVHYAPFLVGDEGIQPSTSGSKPDAISFHQSPQYVNAFLTLDANESSCDAPSYMQDSDTHYNSVS